MKFRLKILITALSVLGAISCTQTDTGGAQADAPSKKFPPLGWGREIAWLFMMYLTFCFKATVVFLE
jgi:hypothetical protein